MSPADWVLLGGMVGLVTLVVYLEGELRIARERLYQAWKDGALIPPHPADVQEPEPPRRLEEEFEPALIDWLGQWEGDEAKDRWVRRIRALKAKKLSVQQIISELDQPNFIS